MVGCAFAAASLAAYQVYDAVCAQAHATEQALLSYARFAAWTFAREAKAELEQGARRVLAPVAAFAGARPPGEAMSGGWSAPSALVSAGVSEAQRCDCVVVPDVRFTFRVDLTSGEIVIGAVGEEIPETPDTGIERAIVDQVRRSATSAVVGDPVVARLSPQRSLAIAYLVIPGGHLSAARPRWAYGFGFDVNAAARATFPKVLASSVLLPPAPASAMPNDSAVSLVVAAPGGRELFRSAAAASTLPGAQVGMAGAFDGLVVRAAVRPALAASVAVGSWTWNRSQLVLGLITLSAGLVIVSLLQLHRERQLARMKSEFVSSVSHELRTPLAQIRMFAEMLRLGWVRSDEERQRSVAIIDQEARRLAHLVENILQFSRAERANPRVSVELLELEPLVDEVVESFAPLARTHGVTVRTEHAGHRAALVDRDAFRQVLLNLLDNAVKYGPRGQTVTVGTCAAGDGRARLWVDDQGPGIPGRDKARIWEPFRRLDRAVAAGITGNGIGLALVRELVQAQGGSVIVEDAPAGGARFVVELRLGTSGPRDSGLGTRDIRGLGASGLGLAPAPDVDCRESSAELRVPMIESR